MLDFIADFIADFMAGIRELLAKPWVEKVYKKRRCKKRRKL